MPQQRLDKLLSSTGRWSRKEARELVRQGRVSVQGRTAAREDEKYEHTAEIRVDGASVDCSPFIYLMLHKPAGLLSATEDSRHPGQASPNRTEPAAGAPVPPRSLPRRASGQGHHGPAPAY